MRIDRREFIKSTAAVSASAAFAPGLLSMLTTGCSTGPSGALDEGRVKSILEKALARGGDFSEVFAEEVRSLEFQMSEGTFSQASVGVSSGIGVRTVEGEKNGYAYVNGYDYEGALDAAGTSAYIASLGKSPAVAVPVTKSAPETITVKVPVESIKEERKLELVAGAEKFAKSFSPYIKQVDISYYDQVQKRYIANSDGLRIDNEIPLIWVVIEVLAEKNGIRHQGRDRISAHQGFEFFDTNDIMAAARRACEECVAMLEAKPSPSGMMPVVMHPGWGGVLIHEAVGHGLEGDLAYRGASVYSDKLGRKVASELVTMVDDSSWPNARGTTGFDDEGTIGQRNVLIEKGILKGFMHDLISARMMKAAPTGNGRRQSYRFFPIPRMTNTLIDPGDSDPAGIIADTKKGLYVKALSGGSVDTVSGQFNFVVREAYLIENGKITTPVSGATLIGRGIDVLENIDAVGNDLSLGVGTCGKGQWVPVTGGLPTVRISSGITVGGSV